MAFLLRVWRFTHAAGRAALLVVLAVARLVRGARARSVARIGRMVAAAARIPAKVPGVVVTGGRRAGSLLRRIAITTGFRVGRLAGSVWASLSSHGATFARALRRVPSLAVAFALAVVRGVRGLPSRTVAFARAVPGVARSLPSRAVSFARAVPAKARAVPSRVAAVLTQPRRGWVRVAHVTLALALVAGITSGGRHLRPSRDASEPLAETAPMAMLDEWARGKELRLAPAHSAPVPASASLAEEGPLRSREMFAFAPWWTLETSTAMDVRGLTTIAYFGVDVGPGGRLIRGGNGWTGFQSQALVDLISRAHKNGTRVVLTAKSFDADVLRSLLSDSQSATRLASELAWTVKAKNLDGVNFDFEFFGDTYRDRFTRFIADVTKKLHAINEDWQITIDTYAASAQIADGFFDVAGIAKAVDALFVMGYDMYRSGIASPNAPLPQYEASIRAYRALAPAEKIIYGTPFYGYDWPTRDNRPHSPAVGSSTPKTYSEIVAEGHPRYWDSAASVPWTAYKVGGQWHEIYYDDPSSLALKAQLADRYKLRGVGAWALRMDRNDHTLIGALTGAVSAIVLGPAGPATLSGSSGGTRPPATSTPRPRTSTSSSPKPKPKPSSSPSPSPSSSPLPVPIPTPSLA